MSVEWTDEKKTKLRQMYRADKTDAEIAEAVGKSVNAVIGQRNKLGIKRPKHQSKLVDESPGDKVESPKAKGQSDDQPWFMAPPVGLLALESHMCKSVREKVGPDNFPTYCGRMRVRVIVGGIEKLSPYCAEHYRLYYNPRATTEK